MLLRFGGIEVVEVWVHSGSITVAGMADGECVDLLGCWEAYPECVPAGIVCMMCDPSSRIVYPNAEALWREHLFALFEKWMLEELAPATRLGIGGDDGFSWAALLRDDDDRGYQRTLPLWLASGMPGSPGGIQDG